MSQPSKPVRRGLGRGLGALIPTAPTHVESPAPAESAPDGAGSTQDGTHPGAGAAPGGSAFQSDVREATAGPDPEAGADTHDRAEWQDDAASREGDAQGGAEQDNEDGYQGSAEAGDGDGDPEAAAEVTSTVTGAYFHEVPIGAVHPNQWQPRQVFEEEAQAELVHSIREIGLLQPIVVREVAPGSFELIMGERRWRAAREAGLETIPAIVRETEDSDMLRDALLENLHRLQLNPLEEAAAYGQLLEDFGCTHEELASRIGRSRPQISNTIRLLKLSPPVQRRVAARVLSAGHARALLSIEDADLQDRLAQRVVAEGISVRGLEEIVAVGDHGAAQRVPRRNKPVAPGLVDLAERLSDRLETRVKVDLGKAKGRITVEFASMEDLRRIVDIMDPRNRDDRPI